MEELLELLQQIQDLAGVGIDALSEALSGGEGEPPEAGAEGPQGAPPEAGGPPAQGGPPEDEAPAGR